MIDAPSTPRSQIDWRFIYHKLMVEHQWTPQQIGQLTPSQMLLLHEKDPTVRTYSPAEAAAVLMPQIEAERKRWEG